MAESSERAPTPEEAYIDPVIAPAEPDPACDPRAALGRFAAARPAITPFEDK